MKFILKLFYDKKSGYYTPNDKHEYGGIDSRQIAAFYHLFPDGFCSFMQEDDLEFLAAIHDWSIEITKK